MDDLQKSKVRLVHWIEHNVDHLKGYEEVAALLEREGKHSVASSIRKGIDLIKAANGEFDKALQDLSEIVGDEHDHEHTHAHAHGHSHSHGHEEAHSHDHPHKHGK
jgi:hypothetical protein